MVVMALPPKWKVTLRQHRSSFDPINPTLELTLVVRATDGMAAGEIARGLMVTPPKDLEKDGAFDPHWRLCRLEEITE